MKIMFVAPAYWPTMADVEKKCWLYIASCAWAGIDSQDRRFFGVGSTRYIGGGAMRVGGLVDWLEENAEQLVAAGYTHVMSTDAWDVMFVRSVQEIEETFRDMGAPPFLMGASSARYGILDLHPPESEKYYPRFRDDIVYRYPTSTFYMGEVRWLLAQMSRIPDRHTHNESRPLMNTFLNDDQFQPMIDHECRMFQEKVVDCIVSDGGRIYNPETRTFPCVVHFSNGCTDPDVGKDPSIVPYAQGLGVIGS